MARLGIRILFLLGAALAVPACASKSSSELASIDQEIARNILWRYHQDTTARFREIRVMCEDRVITLEGRVTDPRIAAEALQIALSESRGGTVNSKLEVRAR